MQRKTSAELEQLILNEVRDLPACKGLKWISIVPVQTTWRAELHGGDDLERQAECKDAIDSVVYRLRGQYDLLPEDVAAKREELTSRAEKLAGEEVDRMLKKSDQPDGSRKFVAELK
jgi:hypothetical protein